MGLEVDACKWTHVRGAMEAHAWKCRQKGKVERRRECVGMNSANVQACNGSAVVHYSCKGDTIDMRGHLSRFVTPPGVGVFGCKHVSRTYFL